MKARFYPFSLLFLAFFFSFIGNGQVHAQACVNTAAGANCTRSGSYYGEILPNAICGAYNSVANYGPGRYFRIPVLLGGCYTISTCGASIDTQIGCFQGLVATTGPFAWNDDAGPECAGLQASVVIVPSFTDYTAVDVRQYNCLPGGTASITVNVRQNNNLSFTSSAADMCEGTVRALTALPARVITAPQPNSGNVGTFTGTGVSGTNFTAPTPGTSSASYAITYTFGYCTTTQNINVFRNPTLSNAGSNQSVCGTSATLAANSPTYGTGTWSLISGSGTITTPTSPTSTVTGLTLGASTVLRWTISNGPCTASFSNVTITSVANPTTANAGPNQLICASSTTLAANTPTVGTGLWSIVSGSATITTPTSPTSTVTGIIQGNSVVLRWTISNSPCTASTSDVTITYQNAPSNAVAGPDQNICATSTTLNATAPAVGTGLWTLISGTGTITTPTLRNTTVTGLVPGTSVTLRWTVSNAPCASTFDEVILTISQAPSTANAGPNQTICTTSTTLAGNAPAVGTGLWSVISGPAVITIPGSPTSTVTGMNPGSTVVLQWTISNAPCAASTSNVTITVETPPSTSNAGSNQTICDTITTLAATVPTSGTGLWSLISGTATITTPSSPVSTVTGMSYGSSVTLRWTVTGGASCTPSTSDVTITIDNPPTPAAAGPAQTVCSSTATMAANVPLAGTGTWAVVSGTGTITSPNSATTTITSLGIGPNTFSWTITNGSCPALPSNVVITRDEDPTTANAGPDQNICLDNTVLAANSPVVGTGIWSVISGSGVVTAPNSPASTLTGLALGSTTLTWSISNGVCPSSVDTVVISYSAVPVAPAVTGNTTICSGSTTTLTATSGAGTPSYTWWDAPTGGNLLFTGAVFVTPILSTTTTYHVEVTNTVTTCTSTRTSVTVTVNPTPTVSIGPDTTTCGNTPVCFNAGGGFSSYLWSNGATTQTACITGVGLAWVQVTNASGCSARDTALITINPQPVVSLGPDQSFCAGSSVTIGVVGTPGNTYLWNTAQTTPMITVSAAGTYILTCTDSLGCEGRDTIVLTQNPAPVAGFSVDTSSCPTITFTNNSTNATIWSWDFGQGSTSTLLNPSNNYQSAGNGNYTVTLIATGPCGADTSSQLVGINCIVGIALPDRLSVGVYPNPSNGTFQVSLTGLEDNADLTIQNLSGQLVFQKHIVHSGSSHREQITLNVAAAGVYFVKLTTGGLSCVQKVVIE